MTRAARPPAPRRLRQAAPAAGMAVLLAVSAPPAGAAEADPRPELVELQLAGQGPEALALTRELLDRRREEAWSLGLGVLAGHLLAAEGEPGEAAAAFVAALGQTPPLAPYSRLRAAEEQEELGHPEVAAGLVATVVDGNRLPAQAAEAVRLLRRSIEAGGDCRLLRGVDARRHDAAERRLLELTGADCALARGDDGAARQGYLALMTESVEDEAAREAAARLAALVGERPGAEIARRLGTTFFQHREFDLAIHYLEPVVAAFRGDLAGERYDLAYTLVRSRFWQEEYAAAAAGFAALAARARGDALASQALYQQGRSHELLGEWPEADAAFRRAYRTSPDGRFADAALIGALRLEWRAGQEERALELFELLAARPQWTEVAARAAIFLAASDVVAGRGSRAAGWLEVAARPGRDTALEVDYWRGRLAELAGEPGVAVRRYLAVLRADLYHPLAQEALVRLRREELAPHAAALAVAQGDSALDLYEAWLLLAAAPEARAEVAGDLARALAHDPGARPFVVLEPVPVTAWSLWRERLTEPEEMLVALGLWGDAVAALRRHFPYDDPALAFTAANLLARSGRLRSAVATAEVLARRVPEGVPPPFLAADLRRLLYPLAYGDLVAEQANRRRIDPYLLLSIIREESRFEPRALSAASARGLTQFVQPTARQVGAAIGLGDLAADDLYRPEVAIALGAAYLSQLIAAFDGADYVAVAAYNAGPPAARLWRSYCVSGEVAEYYSKVSYGETRNYLRKVLGSWMQYRDVYEAPPRLDRWAAGLVQARPEVEARPAAAEVPPP